MLLRSLGQFTDRPSKGGIRIKLAKLANQGTGFAIVAYRGKTPLPMSHALPELCHLQKIAKDLPAIGQTLLVPLKRLNEVRAAIKNMSTGSEIEVEISPEVAKMSFDGPPGDFGIAYQWSKEKDCLVRCLPEGVDYLGDGWFSFRDAYWCIGGTSDLDDLWLRRTEIVGRAIPTFLSSIVPEWGRRGFPIRCEIEYVSNTCPSVWILSVRDDRVVMDISWPTAQQRTTSPTNGALFDGGPPRNVPSLPDHVLVGNILFSSRASMDLYRKLPRSNGVHILHGQDIPEFISHVWPLVKETAFGQVAELEARHRLILGEPELTLGVQRREVNGIGFAKAVPLFQISGRKLSGKDFLESVKKSQEYARIQNGWCRVADLSRVTTDPGTSTIDETAVEGFRLSPLELICGHPQCDGKYWSRVEFPDLGLSADTSLGSRSAYSHVRSLLYWGIPGALFGNGIPVLRHVFRAFLANNEDARVLVVGNRDHLDCFLSLEGLPEHILVDSTNTEFYQWEGSHHQLWLATPDMVQACGAIRGYGWSVVVLLGLENLIEPSKTHWADGLKRCRRSVTIGHFTGLPCDPAGSRDTIVELFGLDLLSAEIMKSTCLTVEADEIRGIPKVDVSRPQKPVAKGMVSGKDAARRSTDVCLEATEGPELSVPDQPHAEDVSIPSMDLGSKPGAILQGRKIPESAIGPFRSGVSATDEEDGEIGKTSAFPQPANEASTGMDLAGGDGPTLSTSRIDEISVPHPERKRFETAGRPVSHGENNVPEGVNLASRNTTEDILIDSARVQSLESESLALWDAEKGEDVDDDEGDVGHPSVAAQAGPSLESQYATADSHEEISIDPLEVRALEEEGAKLWEPATCPEDGLDIYPAILDASEPHSMEVFPPHEELHETDLDLPVSLKLEQPEGNLSVPPDGRLIESAGMGVSYSAIQDVNTPDAGVSTPIEAQIEIDPSKLSQLEEDSVQIRLMLGEEDVESDQVSTTSSRPSELEGVFWGGESPTQQAAIRRILERSSSEVFCLLRSIRDSGWRVSEKDVMAGYSRSLFEVIDDVNDQSWMELGSPLIERSEELCFVAHPYREDLLAVLEDTGQQSDSPEGRNGDGDLSAKWKRFMCSLDEHTEDVLRAFLEVSDPMARVKEIARLCEIMPANLIDKVNTLALSTIRDFVIDTGQDPPVIGEEYREEVARIVQVRG